MKKVFAIIGSASRNSSNLRIVEWLAAAAEDSLRVTIFNNLSELPHFDTDLTVEDTPQSILDFRAAIQQADGVLFCAPEYIFSIPSGLKNALEWCVSTMVFTEKPVGFITASAQGLKGHEELQLILRTLDARFTPETALLIQGVKGKVSPDGRITDPGTEKALKSFLTAFLSSI